MGVLKGPYVIIITVFGLFALLTSMTESASRPLLSLIRQRLANHKPLNAKEESTRAAVLLPILDWPGHDPEIMLTLRASSMSLHAGEVAFPGGMEEPQDNSLTETALREAWEETGLEQHEVEVIAGLDPVVSKTGIQVHPFVGVVQKKVSWVPNPDELDEIFHVPIQYFVDTAPGLMTVEHENYQWQIPEYHYQGFHIWGLTAIVIVNMINLCFDRNYPLHIWLDQRYKMLTERETETIVNRKT